MLDIFSTALHRKMSLDLVDFKISYISDCLRRLVQKDFDYYETYTQTSLKELLAIIYFYYNENPNQHIKFFKLFKQCLYEIETASVDGQPLDAFETFVRLGTIIDFIHLDLFKKIDNGIFDSLIETVETGLKSFFSSLLTAMPRKECLTILFVLYEQGIPEPLWKTIEVQVLKTLEKKFPEESKLETIVKLGQRALPPMRELNEMFLIYQLQKDYRLSFFNPAQKIAPSQENSIPLMNVSKS